MALFTSFAYFMMLRQVIQHENADRGWRTNTRTFRVNPLISFAVFPLGQEYHLTHHLFVAVPHYRLKALHTLLTDYPGVPGAGRGGEGHFIPPTRSPKNPEVLDVVVPAHGEVGAEARIENEVLEVGSFEDRKAIGWCPASIARGQNCLENRT